MKAETTLRLLFPAWGSALHGVDAATLPGGVHQLGEGDRDVLVGVGLDYGFAAAGPSGGRLLR